MQQQQDPSHPPTQSQRNNTLLAIITTLCLAIPSFSAATSASNAAPLTSSSLPESGLTFRGVEDLALPFTEEELLEFLRTATIVNVKVLQTGINNTRKLTLEDSGVSVHAVFRTVDRRVSDTVGSTRPNRFGFRDSYIFEVAAYRLSRMLGIHRVPPAVLREIDGEQGSVQLWIENSTTAADAIKAGYARRHPALFHQQRQLMYAFDQLVFNFDRHHGNILYDERDRLWFIDHTRSFKRLAHLRKDHKPVLSDRQFYLALQALQPDSVKAQMSGVLSKIEIDALLRRRTQLLRHFDDLIAEYGSDAVLIDVNRTVRPGDTDREPTTAGVAGAPSSTDALIFNDA